MGVVTRDRWQGRLPFIMAAIGSAVGLGNVWRFPYVAYSNGGGAFLIPYFVALISAGIPLMILEYALGQKFQKGAPGALGEVNKGFRWVGWLALLVGLSIVFYYVVIMAYAWFFALASPTLSWTKPIDTTKYIVVATQEEKAEVQQKELAKPEGERKKVLTQDENAHEYFYERVLGGYHANDWKNDPAKKSNEAFALVPHLVGFSLLTWVIIFLIIFKGVKSVGRVVMFTVPIPLVLLGVLIVQGLCLEGSGKGIEFFLHPNWAMLKDAKVWLAAYGQVFFSLSLGFGILIAYASYQPRESDVSNNAFITSFCNCATSFYAAFAVFSVLGYLATALNTEVKDVMAGGPGLVFVTYPLALAKMGDIGRVMGVLFFLSLLTLGIDSAFSIVEGVITGIYDYTKKITRAGLAAIICLIGFVFSLIFCLKSGMMWLDIVDNWMSNYGLVFVGLLECIAVGYFFNLAEIRDYINEHSEIKLGAWWETFIKVIIPIVLIFLLVTQVVKDIAEPYGDFHEVFKYSINIMGWGYFGFLLIVAFILGRNWTGLIAIGSLSIITLILHAAKLSLMAAFMGALGFVLLFGGFIVCLSRVSRVK